MPSRSLSFEEAVGRLRELQEAPPNDTKLSLYALYKQATEGACSQPKPSAFDMVGRAKHQAWNSLGTMTQVEAREKYASVVSELLSKEGGTRADDNAEYAGLQYVVGERWTEIVLNRPHKKNAITTQMYRDLTTLLQRAADAPAPLTLLSGTGDYFCSGNDLSNFADFAGGDIAKAARQAALMLRSFVGAFIDHPKVLVVAVNGPAVGIPVTLLGLCDVVYASDQATFHTPFSILGQSPEGCSTRTFPAIMGRAKAGEVLLLGRRLEAEEAKEAGLVAAVLPHRDFPASARDRLAALLENASAQSLLHSKSLLRDAEEREALHRTNEAECARLEERWTSPDCHQALARFFGAKAKL